MARDVAGTAAGEGAQAVGVVAGAGEGAVAVGGAGRAAALSGAPFVGRVRDLVLSLQHPLTYTLGERREKAERNLLASDAELRALGVELHHTERGSDVTFHGPWQAVLYPVLSLRALGLGTWRYVEGLESAMIQVAALHGVSARPGDPGETRVWVGNCKIGAIEVRISSGFTCHGLAFNIDPDLGYFEHIVPCGIAGKGVTSLRREVGGGELPADGVIHDQLVQCLATTLGFTNVEFKDDSERGDLIGVAATQS
ncbi:octanoyltransferase LIP2, mitochondrial-like [Miscanthus floridulus]|uniref:octanoyltransferase LIP2, mitochondrial-like n=1 Tax=Miscanthus floridulus TaxID=154761 RepID=UPI003458C0B7